MHFVDSQTILGAIQTDCYGYQTFFAPIQKAGPVEDWRWVEGNLNISDIITRGATPKELDEGSEWQQGPGFLRRPEAEGPGKMASEIATNVADDVKRLQRKAFSAVVTRSQTERFSGPSNTDVGADSGGSALQPPPKDQCPTPAAEKRTKKPRGVALVRLVGPKRFSSLSKLSGTVAWIRRAVESWLNTKYQASSSPKLEARGPELSVEERTMAFQDLAIEAQDIVFIVDSLDLRSVSQVGGVKTVC